MIFYITLLLILSIAPMIWLNYVFTKNDKVLVNMPFTGLEFGKIILNELGLNDVKIEKSLSIDHYDLNEKKVKVSENRLSRKSLTAISIVCHEIGHAMQHHSLIKICLILVLLSLMIGVIIHLITLEVELDASFNRALPIIKSKVPEEYHDACQSILKAAAFTYVIGVIRNFVSLRFIWLLLSRIR